MDCWDATSVLARSSDFEPPSLPVLLPVHHALHVLALAPGGEHLGTVLVPENVGNHSWGGPDWHTLFIPSSTSVYTIRTTVGPRREPYMA